jgi:hypothetical protein
MTGTTANLSTVSWGNPRASKTALLVHAADLVAPLVEVENTNHYDILYSAPLVTTEAIRGFLSGSQGA